MFRHRMRSGGVKSRVMAITQIREFPNALPHAHLYLDDVEEISRILRDALSADPDRLNTVKPFVRFSTKDLQMDSLEDLAAHGGTTSDFGIEVGDYGTSLRITSFIEPTIHLNLPDKDKRWAVYSQIKAIFERRQYTFKNGILQLPAWLKWTFYALLSLAIPLLEVVHATKAIYIGYLVVALAVGLEMFRTNKVSFVRHRERSKTVAETRKTWAKTIFLIVLGAVIEKLIERAAAHLWPK
jgi:hypothetical protein